jgi:hypothetical protein
MTYLLDDGNPDPPRITRYLLLVYSAKNTSMFRSYGKEMDSLVYFTLYGLGKIAESLKKFGLRFVFIAFNRRSPLSIIISQTD